MIFLPTLISETTYLQWPGSPVGWLGWFLFLMLLILLGWFWRGYQKGWNARGWGIAAGLFVFELAATLFIGIRIPPGQALPAPGLLTSPVRPALMVFAALPWVLAAGLLGPFASMGLAGLSGLLLALFDTHNPFLFLEYAGMGLIMGVAVNQRYRTLFFRAVRHPVVVSLAIVIMYPAVFVLGVVLGLEGDLPIVFDFGLTRVESATVVVAGSLLLAGVVGEVFVFGMPNVWGNQTALLPSPAEKSLETLSFYFLGPVVALVVVVVTLLGWSLSANLAQDLVEERMEGAGKMAAESIPYVLEVGQNLILQLASDSRLARLEASPLSDLLSQQMRLSPYFQELLVVNAEGKVVGAVPAKEQTGVMFPQEQAAIDLALQGVPIQYYTLHPALGGESARLSFIALVSGNDDRVERVLVGRSEFTSNPFASSIVSNLGSISEIGGEGILVDENGAILFHPNPNLIMTAYSGHIWEETSFHDDTSPAGTRNLVYSQPAKGRSWIIVAAVPIQAVQRLALTIAAPLFGLLLLMSIVLMVLLRVVLRFVTGSLRGLAIEATRIAHNQDELATPLRVGGEDEVGQMRKAFELMRASLKDYLDEREQVLLNAEIGRQRLAAILASTPDPVLVTDDRNRLLLANPVAWDVLGDGLEPEQGLPIEDVVSQRDVVKLLTSSGDEHRTEEITLPDGNVYVAKATSVVTDGKRVGRVCVLRDVTRFKEVDALKSEFVSTVSHDLRSPLTLMRGYATMMQMVGELNDEQTKYIRKIISGVESMSRLVNSLLDLGRIEAGVGLNVEIVPIVDLVCRVTGALQLQATQKRVELVAEYPFESMPLVEVDQALVQQALHNLVENAIKYTESGGKVGVFVKTQMDDRDLVIEVRDTGIGISPADQLRLFEKFYRVPSRKSLKQQGSGLGLAIVKSISELHGGRVWVKSELGKGSVFFLEIPFKQPAVV